MNQNQNPEEDPINISDKGAQYFRIYDLWKSVFLQALEIHLKK